MAKKGKVDSLLCNLADVVVSNGASVAIWGDKEIPDSLKEMYEMKQEDNKEQENQPADGRCYPTRHFKFQRLNFFWRQTATEGNLR